MNKYGLIGYPLGHSFSRDYHNRRFAEWGIDARYENFEIPSIEDFPEVLRANPELRGLNVTIPYKEKVIPFLDQLSDEARAIGAVNVIRVRQESDGIHLKGFNSDVIGFTRSIRPLLKDYHRKALVLGTGGASKAVTYGLRTLGILPLYVSRQKRPDAITYQDITREILQEHNVIVNCTPLGMYPKTDDCPPLPYEVLDEHHILYDLVYNPQETLFLKRGTARGAQTKNGLEMLQLQADASWEFWEGKEA